MDSAIHRINLYPLESTIRFPNTYPPDRDFSAGYGYPSFEQPGPEDYDILEEVQIQSTANFVSSNIIERLTPNGNVRFKLRNFQNEK